MSRAHLAVLATVVAAGCASAPPVRTPELPVTPPEAWTVGEELAASVEPSWWRDFEDAGLARVVEAALESNYDVAVAASRLEQAAAQAKVDAADLYPQVNAGLNATRRRQNFIGFPIPGAEERGVLSTTVTTFGVNVQVSWEADLWGRLSAAARASIASYQATAAELDGAKLSIAGQTAKAWFQAAEASEQLRLAQATYESFRASTEQVRERYESGLRPSLDYRLSLANLEAAESNLHRRRRELDLASRQLEILLGRYPGGELEVPARMAAVPPEIPSALPAELVARRPDLTAAERRLVASGELVSVARRSRYPSLSLTASGGTTTRALADLLDGDFGVWSLVGNLVQPIFQGGRLRANVDRAEATEEESLSVYVRQVLGAYFEVERALAAESFIAEQEASLAEASAQSQAAERLADERYRQGLADYITVLEAQRRAFDAESALISIRRQRLDNRIDLYLALGGGFDRYRNPVLAESTETEGEQDR